MKFNTMNSLFEYIENDIKKPDFSVIKFINVEDMKVWVKLKSYLINFCEILRLSSFCSEDDLTPNINRMIMNIKSIKNNTIIIPLSEHFRINNNQINEAIERILKLEYSEEVVKSGIKIYIPMYRFESILEEFIKKDIRNNEKILKLSTENDDDYSLTIISDKFKFNKYGNNLYGYKKYLEYWEDNPSKPIILHTKNAEYFQKNIFFDNVCVLSQPFEILKHNLNENTFMKNMGTEIYWEKLLNEYEENEGTNELLEKIFPIKPINNLEMFKYWGKITDFEKWIYWLWARKNIKNSYLAYVVNSIDEHEKIEEKIIIGIFEINMRDEKILLNFYRERKILLKLMSINSFNDLFWDNFNKKSVNQQLYYLTDNTSEEREKIIQIFLENNNVNYFNEVLKLVYDKFRLYLKEYEFDSLDLKNYFREYKFQKISNKVSPQFIELVEKIANEKGKIWRGLDSRNKIISDVYNEKSLIYWIDALGVEYLGFIIGILEEKYPEIYFNVNIGYSNIPTITENNKDFIINRKYKVFRELDNFIHNNELYKYPENINFELNMINNLLENAVNELKSIEKVIITSDHGASRLAVLYKNESIISKENSIVERNGRYCKDKSNNYEEEIKTCIDENEYHVMADYKRFRISGYVNGEIHGGATLEEVLVPVIEISKQPFVIEYKVTKFDGRVKLQPGKPVVINFSLNKKVEKVIVILKNNRYECKNINGNEWFFEPYLDKNNTYKVKIIVNGKQIEEREFIVEKGLSSNKDFDL